MNSEKTFLSFCPSRFLLSHIPNIIPREVRAINRAKMLQLIFIPENNESVMVTSLPLILDPNPLAIIPGTFDISKWVRPIEIAIQIHDEEKVVFKRDDPLMMIKFTSNNNDSIQLEQKIIDENVIALTSACVRVKNTNPSLNLKSLYKMADFYVSKMRKIILESNK
jgi:hypothetical protein